MTCLDEDTIVAFTDGRLMGPEIARVEDHVASCVECNDLLLAALAAGTIGRSARIGGAAGAPPFTGRPARASAPAAVARGSVIGRYTILGLAGRGGMGEVFAAYDQELDRKVALKLLRSSPGADERGRARLLREAKAMARLSHENVVSVHDAGTVSGRVFVAMEFIDGVTLKDWLGTARTRPEILRAFALAGRGLAAAHAAGIVHRDFKPQNVMMARDGVARVTDFGLAYTMGHEEPAAVSPGGQVHAAAGTHLTRTGELLGTPLYMAPEQFKGEPTDARTDQFSFCVALYEALYGVLPFGDTTLKQLMADVLAGRVQRVPSGATVPGWLRRLLLRGLALDQDARWPSMRALLGALERDPTARRRRVGLAAGLGVFVTLAGLSVARRAGKSEQLCHGGPEHLAGVWTSSSPRRASVQRAFQTSGEPAADEVWARVAGLLDRYADDWLGMYRDACEATHVRQRQAAAILDLRMTCLNEKRSALVALTDVLVAADRGVVSNAVDAARALPPVSACADLKALQAAVEPPRDAVTRQRVEDIRRQAARAKALTDTGKTTQAHDMVRELVQEAQALGYPPLVAEMLLQFCWSRGNTFFSEEVVRAAEESVWTAIASGRDEVAVETSARLGWGVGFYLARPAEGERWLRLSEALFARLGPGHDLLLAWRLQDEASVKVLENQAARSLELVRASRSIKEKILPPEHPDMIVGLQNEAEILHRLGRDVEALEVSGPVYASYVRVYGPRSIAAAVSLNNRGEYLIAAGRPAEAEEPLRGAVEIWAGQVGAEDHVLGYPLTALGRALFALGRVREALPLLERANRLREAGEHDETLVAETRFALARALWEGHGDRSRGRELAGKARDGYANAGTQPLALAAVSAWLADHPGPVRRSPARPAR